MAADYPRLHLHDLPGGRPTACGVHVKPPLHSTGELVFTAGLALLGVGLFVVILGLAATAIVEGRVSLISRSRRMRRRLDELRRHFIVCAYGRVGRAIADELEAEEFALPNICRANARHLDAGIRTSCSVGPFGGRPRG